MQQCQVERRIPGCCSLPYIISLVLAFLLGMKISFTYLRYVLLIFLKISVAKIGAFLIFILANSLFSIKEIQSFL